MHPKAISSDDVRAKLASLDLAKLKHLAELSGVHWGTLYKIQRGETANPGVDTVRRFLPYVAQARKRQTGA